MGDGSRFAIPELGVSLCPARPWRWPVIYWTYHPTPLIRALPCLLLALHRNHWLTMYNTNEHFFKQKQRSSVCARQTNFFQVLVVDIDGLWFFSLVLPFSSSAILSRTISKMD